MLQRNIEIGQRGFPTASQPAFGHTIDLRIDEQGDRIVALVRSYFGTTYVIGTQRGTYIIGVAADVGRRGRPVKRIGRKVFEVGYAPGRTPSWEKREPVANRSGLHNHRLPYNCRPRKAHPPSPASHRHRAAGG